ncbi:hypothetical protein V1279_006067 [Bradyrhizobium sp. AZCC 1610]|uniref:DUF2235 domain-containing protein n=1 Tax=Bradyrhizobium sp. AZCC 1610 TaxID=3117020 RepID=UPI002FF0E7A4
MSAIFSGSNPDETQKEWDPERDGHDRFRGGGGGRMPPYKNCKHIILGIDGTWQAAYADMFQSNVHRLNVSLNFEQLSGDRKSQMFLYSAGVGTANESSREFAGLTGEGVREIVLQAYINLVSNYAPGDQIYLFGFSRGAVAARILAALISRSGLLKPDYLSLIEHAWIDFVQDSPRLNYSELRNVATHSNVKVEFLGLWDVVAGPLFSDTERRKYRLKPFLDEVVKKAVHIVSIDERRWSFAPLLWEGCRASQALEQIWLPGIHCDVGGGYQSTFLATTSLLLMIDRVAHHCPELSFDTNYVEGTLLGLIESEDIVINHERVVKERRRKFVQEVNFINSRHPLADLLVGKSIAIRNGPDLYIPAFENGAAMQPMKFAAPYTDRVIQAVKRKFDILS